MIVVSSIMKFLASVDVNRHPQPSLPFQTSSFCVRRSDAGPELVVRSELLSHSAPLDLVLAPSPQPQTISALGLFSLWHATARSHMRPASLAQYSYAPLEPCSRAARTPLSSCSGNDMDGSARHSLLLDGCSSGALHDPKSAFEHPRDPLAQPTSQTHLLRP